MPEYIFEHPINGEVISIIQGINEKHEYIDAKGIKWNRIFTVPQVGIDSKLDASSTEKDFVEKTKNKKEIKLKQKHLNSVF